MSSPVYQAPWCHIPADSNILTAARTSHIETKQRWISWNLNFHVRGSCVESLQVCWVFWQTRVFLFLSRGYWLDNALVIMSGKEKRNVSSHPSTIQQAVRLSVKQWTWHLSTSVLPTEHNYKILIEQKRLMRMILFLQFFRQVLRKNCALLGCYTVSCGDSLPAFRYNLFISWLNRAKHSSFCTHKACVFACVRVYIRNWSRFVEFWSFWHRSNGNNSFYEITPLAALCAIWRIKRKIKINFFPATPWRYMGE
jgi:hypothetical protein